MCDSVFIGMNGILRAICLCSDIGLTMRGSYLIRGKKEPENCFFWGGGLTLRWLWCVFMASRHMGSRDDAGHNFITCFIKTFGTFSRTYEAMGLHVRMQNGRPCWMRSLLNERSISVSTVGGFCAMCWKRVCPENVQNLT